MGEIRKTTGDQSSGPGLCYKQPVVFFVLKRANGVAALESANDVAQFLKANDIAGKSIAEVLA